MNRRMILYILAKMMGVEGVLLLLPAFVGLLYGEKSGACFLFPATILALIILYSESESRIKRRFMQKKV